MPGKILEKFILKQCKNFQGIPFECVREKALKSFILFTHTNTHESTHTHIHTRKHIRTHIHTDTRRRPI